MTKVREFVVKKGQYVVLGALCIGFACMVCIGSKQYVEGRAEFNAKVAEAKAENYEVYLDGIKLDSFPSEVEYAGNYVTAFDMVGKRAIISTR